MKITDQFKDTLSDSGKFLTLALAITMFEKCTDIFLRYGISPETLSFMKTGLEKICEELEEGYKYIRLNQDFNRIIKSLKDRQSEN